MERTLILALLGATALELSSSKLSAIDDIASTNMVWLQGVIPLEISYGFRNEGVLRLESIDDSFGVALFVNGFITNAPSGQVQINVGAGGGRGISADWINEGQFLVNYVVDLSRSNGVFYNRGLFRVVAGGGAVSDSPAGTFYQDEGSLEIMGDLLLKHLTFVDNGGSITGAPILLNASLKINSTAVPPANFVFAGLDSQLLTPVPPGFGLFVRGSDLEGASFLNITNGTSSAGLISLNSTNVSADSGLVLVNGSFTNLPTGTIEARRGFGGTRSISGDVMNQGTIIIDSPNTPATPPKDDGTNAQPLAISITPLLILSNNFNQSVDGKLVLNLSTPLGSDVEACAIKGVARFDGVLQLDLNANFIPAPQTEFRLLSFGGRSGSFQTINVPTLPDGLRWHLDFSTNMLSARITAAVELPSLSSVRLLANSAIALLVSGTVGGGFVLQTSTNLTDWSSIQTNNSFNGLSEIFQTNIDQAPYRFYRTIPPP